MVTLCMTIVSDRIAAEAAAASVAVPQMTTPTAPRLSKDEGRAKWARERGRRTSGWRPWRRARSAASRRSSAATVVPAVATAVPSAAAAASLKPAAPTRARARAHACRLKPGTKSSGQRPATTPWAKGTYPTARGRRRPAPPGAQGAAETSLRKDPAFIGNQILVVESTADFTAIVRDFLVI